MLPQRGKVKRGLGLPRASSWASEPFHHGRTENTEVSNPGRLSLRVLGASVVKKTRHNVAIQFTGRPKRRLQNATDVQKRYSKIKQASGV